MEQLLYLECKAGISGDMFVAAMLDLGADQKVLKKALESLSVSGFTTEITRVSKSGLDACDFNVILDEQHENHDHDMAYLYGQEHVCEHSQKHTHEHTCEHSQEHTHEHTCEHSQEHACEHSHEHDHTHDTGHVHKHEHVHEHRGLKEILPIIQSADMTPRAKQIAEHIFWILAKAEAKAHGVPLDEVHFHEIGAVDSIVDILSAAVCFDNLGIEKVVCSNLYEGQGTVRCQHGILPIPVPAVANIISMENLKLHLTQVQGELVTPTGAAIVAAIGEQKPLPEAFYIRKIGLGAGKREYETSGILRAMIIEAEEV